MLVEGRNKGMKPEESVGSGNGREPFTYCFMTEKYCFGGGNLESDLFFLVSLCLCIFYSICSVVFECYFVFIQPLPNCFHFRHISNL